MQRYARLCEVKVTILEIMQRYAKILGLKEIFGVNRHFTVILEGLQWGFKTTLY